MLLTREKRKVPNVAPSDPAEGVLVERGFCDFGTGLGSLISGGLNEAVEFFLEALFNVCLTGRGVKGKTPSFSFPS